MIGLVGRRGDDGGDDPDWGGRLGETERRSVMTSNNF